MLLSKSYIRIFLKWIFIFKDFILSYSYISLYMSVDGHKGQKRVSDLLQLKLQAVMNSWCGCWVPNPGLCKSRCTRNCWAVSLALNPQGNCGGSWALVRDDEDTMAEQMGECCHLRSIRLESSGWSQRVCSLCFLSCAFWFLLLCCGCGHCPLRAIATAVTHCGRGTLSSESYSHCCLTWSNCDYPPRVLRIRPRCTWSLERRHLCSKGKGFIGVRVGFLVTHLFWGHPHFCK